MYFRSAIQRSFLVTGATLFVAVVSVGTELPQFADDSGHSGGARVSEQDENRVAAQKLLDEGFELQKQGTAEALRRAMASFETALPLWRASGDRVNEAKTLNYIASIAHNLSQPQKALDMNNRALSIWQALDDKSRIAATLSAIGWTWQSMGELEKALEFYERALPIRHTLEDKVGEAQTLNTIGTILDTRGDSQRALDYYDRALPLARGDKRMEAYTLSNIAYAQYRRGENHRALDYIGQALPLWRAIGNRYGEAEALNTVGNIQVNLGHAEKALDSYGEALTIHRATGFRLGEGQVLSNIGRVHHRLGDFENAVDYYMHALKIFQDVGNLLEQALALNNLALVSDKLGESPKALDYLNRSLLLQRRVQDRPGEVKTLNSIGTIYVSLKQPREALAMFRAALEIATSIRRRVLEAYTLYNAASTHLRLGEKQEAREYLSRLQPLRGEFDEEAAFLSLLSRIDREDGNLVEARKRMETVLDFVEADRARTTREGLRALNVAAGAEYHEFYIDLTMELNKLHPSASYVAAALEASERARARTMLGTLGEAHTDIRRGVDPALADRERYLQQLINARAERITRLVDVKNTERQREETRTELDGFLTEYQTVQAQIKTRSPGYAAITQPQPLSVSDIQKKVLDSDTLLLEYSLGEERSYVWALTPTSLMSFELPKRAVIEATARRLYELLAQGRSLELEVQLKLAAAELSEMVLGPVARQLERRRLAIVADGALQYIPFGALPIPSGTGNTRQGPGNRNQLLIAEHEIVSLPSASVLAVLRQELAGRQPANKTVAVLADPVLRSDDPRVKGMLAKTQRSDPASTSSPDKLSTGRDPLRSMTESGGASLDRLPYTREEASAIIAFAQEGKRLEAVDFDASRLTATSPELADYRIVHFATHGLLNSRHPELSGIVLSLVDERGQPQDGFLRLHDIYNMKLGADLVVLSACRTALGKDVKGEGLVGLTRGFMYAGAPRVVASLWDVRDAATAELMKRFYRGMLKDGLRPLAALRAAQISMSQDKRWEAPYYWAGFVLQGEWK